MKNKLLLSRSVFFIHRDGHELEFCGFVVAPSISDINSKVSEILFKWEWVSVMYENGPDFMMRTKDISAFRLSQDEEYDEEESNIESSDCGGWC